MFVTISYASNMIRFAPLFIVASFTLVGCGGPSLPFYKQGAGEEKTARDRASCAYDVGMNKVAKDEQPELIRACMRAKGYRYNG